MKMNRRRAATGYAKRHASLREHLAVFLDAYDFAKRLKSLGGLTPFERICQLWTEQREKFRLDPLHHMPGPETATPHRLR